MYRQPRLLKDATLSSGCSCKVISNPFFLDIVSNSDLLSWMKDRWTDGRTQTTVTHYLVAFDHTLFTLCPSFFLFLAAPSFTNSKCFGAGAATSFRYLAPKHEGRRDGPVNAVHRQRETETGRKDWQRDSRADWQTWPKRSQRGRN